MYEIYTSIIVPAVKQDRFYKNTYFSLKNNVTIGVSKNIFVPFTFYKNCTLNIVYVLSMECEQSKILIR